MTEKEIKAVGRMAVCVVGALMAGMAGCAPRATMPVNQSQATSQTPTSMGGGTGVGATTTQPLGSNGAPATLTVKSDPRPVQDPGSIADAAAKIEPSVVTINTAYRPPVRTAFGDEDGPPDPDRVVPLGTGSGVIFSADGLIVTNNHVVRDASVIHVTLQDDRELDGRVIGADPQTDLAVIKVDAKDLPAATLADSDKVRVGEWAIAVGDPLRVGTTVTAGIVSALRKGSAGAKRSAAPISVIQTDAAINPGNSGGALADIQGRLIGINSAIASPNGGNVGIGFAIPVNTVRDIARQLVASGRVIRPWLGVAFLPINERTRSGLNPATPNAGVLIAQVVPGSPAQSAGLQPGDVITAMDGVGVANIEALQAQLRDRKVGDSLRLTVSRSGSTNEVTAQLAERPANPPRIER